MNTTPRIYVACLASYNAGTLYGRWIDASTDADEMNAAIQEMLAGSPCPNVVRQKYEDEDGATRYVDTSTHSFNIPDGWKKIGAPFPSAEEWAIHDYEGLGGDLGEYAGLAEVARRVAVVELAEERDIPAAILLEYARDCMSGEWDADDLESQLGDNYDGQADTWLDFTTSRAADMGYNSDDLPEWARNYVDWESMAHDWEIGGDWSAYRDGDTGPLYFFRTH